MNFLFSKKSSSEGVSVTVHIFMTRWASNWQGMYTLILYLQGRDSGRESDLVDLDLLNSLKWWAEILTIRIWDYVLSVCDWVCVHNLKPEVLLFESRSALYLPCPEMSQRYLSGSPMCLASHGKINAMLMRTLTKTFLAWNQNIPGLMLRGCEISIIRF